MEKSALFQLIQSFSPVELRDVRKFLNSPFFNQRQDLVQLFEQLAEGKGVQKEVVWTHLFKREKYNDQKLRLLMSYLHQLLERYIAIKEFTANPVNTQLHTAMGYRNRRLPDAFNRTVKNLEKALELQPLRNVFFHETQYKLQWEVHQVAYPQNPTDLSRLQDLSLTADQVYLAQKLRLICLLAAHQSVYQSGAISGWDEELIARAEQTQFSRLPAIAVYLHCYRMLCYPAQEDHFQQFKSLLLHQSGQFSTDELHGLYILAVNYCIRRLNAGDARFYQDVLDFYKQGLAHGHLLENGMLTRFTYHNVVAAGLNTGELEWVRYFIHEYKNRLEKRYRESSFSFSLARLEYALGNFDHVLELLQKANYRDPLLNLSAKTLLLKTYFDLGEYETLQSHMDAMRNYIHRKRVLGYHRTNYLNIIRYTEKIMRMNPGDRTATEGLLDALQQEEVLTEKAYFQKILHVSQ